MKELRATFTSKGRLVIPAELRRKYGIVAGTQVRLMEDQFGRTVLHLMTEEYADRFMGLLAGGPDLLAHWEKNIVRKASMIDEGTGIAHSVTRQRGHRLPFPQFRKRTERCGCWRILFVKEVTAQ